LKVANEEKRREMKETFYSRRKKNSYCGVINFQDRQVAAHQPE